MFLIINSQVKKMLLLLALIVQAIAWDFTKRSCQEPCTHYWWRYQLLKNVNNFTNYNLRQLTVFGENAAPIIVGSQGIMDVAMGAAQLGNGRIVVITNSQLGDNFIQGNHADSSTRQLHNNIRRWVTKTKRWLPSYNFNITSAFDYVQISNPNPDHFPILFLQEGSYSQSNTFELQDKIADYVKSGGGLFIAISYYFTYFQDPQTYLSHLTLSQAGFSLHTSKFYSSSVITLDDPLVYKSNMAYQFKAKFFSNGTLTQQQQKQSYDISFRAKYVNIEGNTYFLDLLANISTTQLDSFTPIQTDGVYYYNYKTFAKALYYHFLVNEVNKAGLIAPKVDLFPGYIDPNSATETVSFEFSPRGQFTDFYHTGYYALPGQVVTINVHSPITSPKWKVYVGFHLYQDYTTTLIYRWPRIYKRRFLNQTQINITSAFGGLIVFQSPSSSVNLLNVTISNIVKAPYFNSQNSASITQWSTRKNLSPPWCIVQGKWVGFHIQSSQISLLDSVTLKSVLDRYDTIYEQLHVLRDTAPANVRKTYISFDNQYVLSDYNINEYPISVYSKTYGNFSSNKYVLSQTILTTSGQWDLFVSIGDIFQLDRQSWYNPFFPASVTSLIFALRAMYNSTGLQPDQVQYIIDLLPNGTTYLQNPNYTQWKNNRDIAILTYAQIILDFGWGPYDSVLGQFQADTTHPSYRQQNIDLFWGRVSVHIGYDMTIFLQKWAINYTSAYTTYINNAALTIPYVQINDILT